MTTTTIVFFSSLFLVSLLVLIKAIELKYAKKNLLLRLISRLDDKSSRFVSIFKFKILQIIQTIRYIALIKTKEFFVDYLKSLEEKIINEYKIKENILMGRREIINKGSVSFYLKKIDETKRNGTRGEIL